MSPPVTTSIRGNPAGHVHNARGSDGSPERTPLCLCLAHYNVTAVRVRAGVRVCEWLDQRWACTPAGWEQSGDHGRRSTWAIDACKNCLKLAQGAYIASFSAGKEWWCRIGTAELIKDSRQRVQNWQNRFLFSSCRGTDSHECIEKKKIFPIGNIFRCMWRQCEWIYHKNWQ